jgi:hypothetical protein
MATSGLRLFERDMGRSAGIVVLLPREPAHNIQQQVYQRVDEPGFHGEKDDLTSYVKYSTKYVNDSVIWA